MPRTRPRHGPRSVPSTWRAILALKEAGVFVEVGAFADVSASVVLVRAESAEAALEIVRDDVLPAQRGVGRATGPAVRAGRRSWRPFEVGGRGLGRLASGSTDRSSAMSSGVAQDHDAIDALGGHRPLSTVRRMASR